MIDSNTPQVEENIYAYASEDAPDDLVVNMGNQTLIVNASAFIPKERGRIEVGDRRRGSYYVDQCLGKMPGLMLVRDVKNERLNEVEKVRQIREKIIPPDWVREARIKAKLDEASGDPPFPVLDDAKTLLSPLQQAARGVN